MRIKQIKLNNFMNHVDSTFDCSEFLTCITGPNDSGKSVVLYAIRWFSSGEPKGDQVISNFRGKKAKKCSVELIMEDNSNFIKERTSNNITLFKAPAWGKQWSKSDLPKEIADVIQIKPYKFGSLEFNLNFSFQLDSPFLISEAASMGAVVISKFSGTEVIDLVNKDLEKENWHLNKDNNTLEKSIEDKNSEIVQYDFLKNSSKELEACNRDLNVLEKNIALYNRTIVLNNSYKDYLIKLNSINCKLKLVTEKFIDSLNCRLNKIDRKSSYLDDLYKIKKQYDFKTNELNTQNRHLVKLKELSELKVRASAYLVNYTVFYNTVKIKDNYKRLSGFIKEVEGILSKFVNLSNFDIIKLKKEFKSHWFFMDLNTEYTKKKYDLDNIKTKEKHNSLEILKAKTELKSLWEQVGWVCPTCNSIIKKRRLQ